MRQNALRACGSPDLLAGFAEREMEKNREGKGEERKGGREKDKGEWKLRGSFYSASA